jgi:hypothetical protein
LVLGLISFYNFGGCKELNEKLYDRNNVGGSGLGIFEAIMAAWRC